MFQGIEISASSRITRIAQKQYKLFIVVGLEEFPQLDFTYTMYNNDGDILNAR